MSKDKAFVVIPAFNEQARIASVIEAARAADANYIFTDHIVVVDNNSNDETAATAEKSGAAVLTCEAQGKGWAMLAGATYALEQGAGALAFLDADLIDVRPDHIDQLVQPVLHEEAAMVIGYLGGRYGLAKMILGHWGGFSGQRAVSLEVWDELKPQDFKGWRIEGALNAICRNTGQGAGIQRIELEGLFHLGKRHKEPTLFHAGWRYAQTYSSAIRGLMSRSGTVLEPLNIR